MSNGDIGANWPRLLALSVHELRTPLSVVLGYVRILLTDRAGPLSDRQRKLLEEAAKSCARLSDVTAEMSDLSQIEEGKTQFNRSPIDLRALLATTIAALPEMPDRDIRVELSTGGGSATVEGDPVRLKLAFTSLLHGLRRELVTSQELHVHERTRRENGRAVSWIAIAAPDRVAALAASTPDTLVTFDEWRGGCGLSLAVARRIIERHGGRLWSAPPDPDVEAGTARIRPWKASAVAMLPVV
jgi:K+-sensing histidine kinase KdpD